MIRNTPPPLASNDLLGRVRSQASSVVPSDNTRYKIGSQRPQLGKQPRNRNTSTERYESVSNDARPNEVCITVVTTKATHFERYAKWSELIVLRVGSMIAVKIHRNKETCATRKAKD